MGRGITGFAAATIAVMAAVALPARTAEAKGAPARESRQHGVVCPTKFLTPKAMRGWRIVCGARAIPSERYAAKEFQTLFSGLTGSTLPIVDHVYPGAGAVLIGSNAVRAAGVKMPAAALGEEGLRIKIEPNTLAIDGGRPRGTLYGVYEFFEELCGVRYLTHDDTYYPPKWWNIRLPLSARVFTPRFAFRWSFYAENSHYPDFAARLHTNTVSGDPTLGGKTGYQLVNHCVAYLVPPAVYGKTHPEYYALRNGRRAWNTTQGGGPQLCLTNPAVVDRVTEALEKQIGENPTQRNFNIAQMDNSEYCTCPRCAALDAQEGSHSATLIAFVNKVAERIEKRHPNVLISTFAYDYTRKPPKTLRPRRNVLIQLCSIECCTLHAIDDPNCAINRNFCRDMAIWNSKCDKIFLWHYITNFAGYLLPFPNLRNIGASAAYFARHSGRGVFMEASGGGMSTEMSDLRNYVTSRCLWKPGRDSWTEAMDFCRLHYRESAGPIIAYLTWYHKLVQATGAHPGCFPTEATLHIDPPTARKILAFFRDAMSRAKSDVVRDRVEKASMCAYRAALSAASMDLDCSGPVCRPNLDGLDPHLLERYEGMCRKFGASMDTEEIPTAAYLTSLRSLFTGLHTVRIENRTWRVTLLPESNGKVLEMFYKPTRRNVVRARRAFNRFRYEEWTRAGSGPAGGHVYAYTVAEKRPDRVVLTLKSEDGTRFERTIALSGDAVRFDTTITAAAERPLQSWVHPEYDTVTLATDPRQLMIYVKRGGAWIQANKGWKAGVDNPAQQAIVRDGVSGGAYAYFTRAGKFGVEQRFDPKEYRELGVFWDGSRRQINLEMFPNKPSLAPGERTHYGFEVRYLRAPL